ncbi:MAG TPA: phospholipase D-like domain-containing protein [Blastocatellia bacterium]|nr:phospholipase D-like domain-containing protein [Blastocatellia bacterium]
MSSDPVVGQSVFQRWLDSLKGSDPALYKELTKRLEDKVATPESVRSRVSGVSLESVSRDADADVRSVALETIVREGRPALLVQNNRISPDGAMIDAAARVIVERLRQAAPVLEPLIPLVGRIDVANYPGPYDFLGSGWLVDRNIVVTNRHVAELIAQAESGKFRFRPGRFGEEMKVSLDYRHEKDITETAVSKVIRVIWIETDPSKADIAFLEVDRRTDGTRPEYISLADQDAQPDSHVAVIGYPARAPAHIIPNQAWMDQIYGSTYDIKRIAPGLMGANSRGWATHDCTTLGGNSGSTVLDMDTGKAVALHFAGLYMIENYAVPASTIRDYLRRRPWQSASPPRRDEGSSQKPPPRQPDPASPSQQISRPSQQTATSGVETRVDNGQVSMTIPLTITVSLGAPQILGTKDQASSTDASGTTPAPSAPRDIEEAARNLQRDHQVESVYSVWPGYEINQGRLTDDQCLVVYAHPERLDAVRSAMPRQYAQFPVEVRPASIEQQLEDVGVSEAAASISYNDGDRTGPGFSFNWVDEEMKAILHVGPERSWTVLSDFLNGTENRLISSMYEFHAEHIADAVEHELDEGAKMMLVLARQSRDPQNGRIDNGDFGRTETFNRWEERFGNRFDLIFVPLGVQGLVANSYHIKVTVRDGSTIWLSSGNWKRSSQPLIPTASLNNPRVTGNAGNREWHVVIENDTLATRFANHIKADFQQSGILGGTNEAVDDEIMVDVPATMQEAVEFEAAPARVIEPLKINRRIRVKPLLTPDKKGAVYSNAVLQLIRSARRQLLFQNQYIKMSGANGGFMKQLVDALAEKAQELEDFRIILRSGDLEFDLSQLKRRGIDVDHQVRILANTHTKGIIVDGKRVLVGSHNWSSSGVTLNRDASLIFDDEEAAQYYSEAFELDWDRSRPARVDEAINESVRPAQGDEPPAGFVRMRLSEYLGD